MSGRPALPLGAVLAGGASRRYGSPKALARVGGRRLVDRVAGALRRVVPDPVLIANDAALAALTDLPARPDLLPGGGAMAGVHAALAWASELDRPGALVVACDLPLIPSALLARLVEEANGTDAAAVAPEGPDGRVEPLCAWYGPALLPEAAARLAAGRRSLRALWDELPLRRLAGREVAAYGDPSRIFLNVNTPAERERAEALLSTPEGIHAAQ